MASSCLAVLRIPFGDEIHLAIPLNYDVFPWEPPRTYAYGQPSYRGDDCDDSDPILIERRELVRRGDWRARFSRGLPVIYVAPQFRGREAIRGPGSDWIGE